MLSQRQLQKFNEDGFLVVDNVLDKTLIQRLRSEYESLVDRVADDRKSLTANWQTLAFEEKLNHLIANDPAAYEFLDISLPLKEGLDESAGVHTGPAVFDLITFPGILDIAESIVGPELISNPVQHVRIKPPEKNLNEAGRGK